MFGINWKHVLVVAVGTGLTALFQKLEGEDVLTLVTLGHDAAAAGMLALAALMKGIGSAS